MIWGRWGLLLGTPHPKNQRCWGEQRTALYGKVDCGIQCAGLPPPPAYGSLKACLPRQPLRQCSPPSHPEPPSPEPSSTLAPMEEAPVTVWQEVWWPAVLKPRTFAFVPQAQSNATRGWNPPWASDAPCCLPPKPVCCRTVKVDVLPQCHSRCTVLSQSTVCMYGTPNRPTPVVNWVASCQYGHRQENHQKLF